MDDRIMTTAELISFLQEIKEKQTKGKDSTGEDVAIKVDVHTKLSKDKGKFSLTIEMDIHDVLETAGGGFEVNLYAMLMDHVKKCLES